jgi:hypothetical protein
MLAVSTGQYSGASAKQVVQEALTQLTGLDGSSVRYNPAQLADREARLNANVNEGLLHQTGVDGCRGIITSGRMNLGQKGIAAAGIYFAVTADDTMHKAQAHGFLFTLRVRLGTVEHWTAQKVDPHVTYESLQRKGVDSVHIPRPGGDEYVVYHSDQVELRLVQKVQLPAHYVQRAGFFSYPTPCPPLGLPFQTSALRSNAVALAAFLAGDEAGAHQLVRSGGGGRHGGAPPDDRPVCRYAPYCYRRNAEHWQQCVHPGQRHPVAQK